MKSPKIPLRQLVVEFVSIVFAVLLALTLTSYKQEYDLRKESEKLTQQILKECDANLVRLDSVILANGVYMAYFDSLSGLDNIEGFRIEFSNEFLTSSTWDYAQRSRAFTYINPDLVEDAASAYEVQEFYMDISNDMFQNIGTLLLNAKDANQKTLVSVTRYYLSNIMGSAAELHRTYETLLENHGSQQDN